MVTKKRACEAERNELRDERCQTKRKKKEYCVKGTSESEKGSSEGM